MDVTKTRIPGLYFLEMDMHRDSRGFFARNFCAESINSVGGFSSVSQANISLNTVKGTIRGFHYQMNGHEEAKTVTVYKGKVHYKVIDLRKESPTYLEHESFEISELSGVIQVPEGCVPAFQTLEDDVLLHYYVSKPYSKDNEYGIRYDDPYFNFSWPLKPSVISPRDLSFEEFNSQNFIGLKG